jgi:uncharacterized protein YfcZ (UPF0381/DUF406 family)
MTDKIHPDAVDAEAEFESQLTDLVEQAEAAGLSGIQIRQALKEQRQSVKVDTSVLFG